MKRKSAEFLALLLILISIFFSFSGITYNSFDGEYFRIAETSDGKIQAYAEDDKNSYLVYGGVMYVYSREKKETINTVELGRKTGKFIFNNTNNKLYVFSSDIGNIRCEIWSVKNMTLIETITIEASYLDLEFLSVDSSENIWFVEHSNLRKLNLYSLKTGTLTSLLFDKKINSLCTLESLNIVYSDLSIFRIKYEMGEIKAEALLTSGNVPCQLISYDRYISAAGELCSLSDGEEILSGFIIPDISSSLGTPHLYFSPDYLGGVYGISGSRTLAHADSSAKVDYRYSADAVISAVGQYSLVVYRSGQNKGLYISEYDSFTVRSSSGDSELTIPDSWNVSGGYIIVLPGTTAASMISESGGTVSDGDVSVTSGTVRTGMTLSLDANSYVIAVVGDVNSSGTSNSKDFLLMEKYITGEIQFDGTAFTAADINEDGIVNVMDLLLFRNLYLL